MKNLKYFRNIIITNIDVLLFCILVTMKMLFYGQSVATGYFSYAALFPAVFSSVIVIVGISYFFSPKKRSKILFVTNIVLSSLIIADLCYFRYFKDILSIPVLRNGILLGGVKSSVSSLIKVEDFLYLADIFLMVIINRIKKSKGIYPTYVNLKTSLKVTIAAVLLVSSIGVNAKYIYDLSVEQPRLLTSLYNRMYITNILGNLDFHVLDIYNFACNTISSHKPLAKEEVNKINNYLTTKTDAQTSKLKSAYKGKNLIIIQVEALQQFVINNKVNGQEITPNLNRWIKKSMYFNNYFYQVAAGNTSDAEFMSNNSLYPAPAGAAYYLYCGDKLKSLPTLLKEKGYTTAAYHGYTEGFWNRNVMYKTEGFDTFYGQSSFNIDEKIGLGLSDKSFLTQSLAKLKTMKKPYYSMLITLTSHFPYDDPTHYGTFDVGEWNGTFMGNYLKAIHYTDEQLGMFLDSLEKEGIMKDSLVVLYGDHYSMPREHMNELYKFMNVTNGNDLTWSELQKVPMLIHFPNDAHKGTNKTYAGQMDLLPTLANLMDIHSNYMLGNDLLNTKNGTVIFRSGSFTDGKVYYVSSTNTYYDLKTKLPITETPELKTKKSDALTELQYSDQILTHDLIKKFEESKTSDK